jgi:hypothetical protein
LQAKSKLISHFYSFQKLQKSLRKTLFKSHYLIQRRHLGACVSSAAALPKSSPSSTFEQELFQQEQEHLFPLKKQHRINKHINPIPQTMTVPNPSTTSSNTMAKLMDGKALAE